MRLACSDSVSAKPKPSRMLLEMTGHAPLTQLGTSALLIVRSPLE